MNSRNGSLLAFTRSLFLPEGNGVEWKYLLDNKLNKDFHWEVTFQAALGKHDEDAIEKAGITFLSDKY